MKKLPSKFVLFVEQFKILNIATTITLLESNPRVMGDGNQIEQVIANLLTNARDSIADAHGPMGGNTSVTSKIENDSVIVEVISRCIKK